MSVLSTTPHYNVIESERKKQPLKKKALGLFEKKVSPSPPLTIGIVNIFLGKIKGARVIYNVQEIYPDLLIEKGWLKSKIVISVLKGMERFVYNHFSRLIVIIFIVWLYC